MKEEGSVTLSYIFTIGFPLKIDCLPYTHVYFGEQEYGVKFRCNSHDTINCFRHVMTSGQLNMTFSRVDDI